MSGEILARRAIEALRAGVPNDAAILALGTGETALGTRFRELLDAASPHGRLERTRGLIVAGGFGAGKSHLLGHLKLQALANNFVVSAVTISKETPLWDLRAVYLAAMRGARAPQSNDEAMRVTLGRLKPGDPAFEDLVRWASTDRRVAPVFAAMLHLMGTSATSSEMRRRFERFLMGGKLNKTVLRQALAEVGAKGVFDLKFTEAAIGPDLMRFAPRLIRAAGFGGWCVLLDEVELIGRYTPLQRGKAYSELSRWLGFDEDTAVDGLVAAAAITDDFATEVIVDKRDDQLLEDRLRNRGLTVEAARAGLAMSAIKEAAIALQAPTEADLARDLQKVRRLYERAYGWPPPEIPVGPRESSKRMRSFIRSWITQWDILRLYHERSGIETATIATDYGESAELEASAEDADGDDDG